jgi:hypothetical protein
MTTPASSSTSTANGATSADLSSRATSSHRAILTASRCVWMLSCVCVFWHGMHASIVKLADFVLQMCWHWADNLLEGLQTLQANDIMHRDIKPDNLFVSTDLNLKIGEY